MRFLAMSRKDSSRYLRRRLRVRRLSAAEEQSSLLDPDESESSPSSVAEDYGTSGGLMLHAHEVADRSVTQVASPGDSGASTSSPMDLRWLAKELRRQLRDKALENESLKQPLEAARQSCGYGAHRQRR
jgi:hypothetical protein